MTHYLMTKTQKAKLKEEELQDWKPSEKGNSIVYDKRIGRNTKCPCGSNKKYKNCCKEN